MNSFFGLILLKRRIFLTFNQEEEEEEEDLMESEGEDGANRNSIALPPKKRNRSGGKSGKSGMTEEEIKRATMAALAAKPVVIGLDRIKKKLTQSEDENSSGFKVILQ